MYYNLRTDSRNNSFLFFYNRCSYDICINISYKKKIILCGNANIPGKKLLLTPYGVFLAALLVTLEQ